MKWDVEPTDDGGVRLFNEIGDGVDIGPADLSAVAFLLSAVHADNLYEQAGPSTPAGWPVKGEELQEFTGLTAGNLIERRLRMGDMS